MQKILDALVLDLPSLAVIAALLLVERLVRAPRTDWMINLVTWLMSVVFWALLYNLAPYWKGPALIDGSKLPVWAAVPIYVLVFDFGEWLFHRLQHRIPTLWAMHSLHHSDPEMSVLTTHRHFWGDKLLKAVTVWSLCLMVISPTKAAVATYAAISVWNLFVHSRLEVDFGRWSWLLNCPAYHRRHHSILPQHYNSNFAALFPIWDVLAGTYHRADGFPPTGLDVRPHTAAEVFLWPLLYRRRADAAASLEAAV